MTVPEPREHRGLRGLLSSTLTSSILFGAAALALRLYRLGDQSLWNDEMFSFDVAAKPLAEIPATLAAHYHHPPLYFALLHFSLVIFGQSAWALRFPSAIFGACTAGLGSLLAYRLGGKRSAAIAGSLILIAPFHLAYSQEGRPYALAGLLCLASFYGLYELTRSPRKRWMAFYIVSLTALLYTHHWGIFVLASHVAVLLFRRFALSPLQRRMLLFSWFVTAMLYLPEYFALRAQMVNSAPDGWFWVQKPNGSELYDLLLAFSGTYFAMASSIFSMSSIVRIGGGAAMAILLLVLVRVLFVHRESAAALAAACGISTLIIPWIVSWFKPEVFLWYRYTVIALPLVFVAIGAAVDGEKGESPRDRAARLRRLVQGAAVIILLAAGAAGTSHYYSWQKSNVREVAGYVGEVAHQDSIGIIIRPASFAFLLNYYYRGDAVQYDEAYLNSPLGAVVDTASAFIYISLDLPNEIRAYFDTHFTKIAEKRFPGEAHMGMVVGAYRQRPENGP